MKAAVFFAAFAFLSTPVFAEGLVAAYDTPIGFTDIGTLPKVSRHATTDEVIAACEKKYDIEACDDLASLLTELEIPMDLLPEDLQVAPTETMTAEVAE